MAKSKHSLESVERAIQAHRNVQLKRDMIHDDRGKPTGVYGDPHIVIMGPIGQKMLGKLDYIRRCHPKVKVIDKRVKA